MSDLISPTELDGEQPDESLPKWFLEAAAGLAIFVAAVVVYLPAVNGEMLWHDRNYISDTPTSETTELILNGRRGLRDIWLTGKAMEYFPLTNSLFWLEWRLWSKEDGGFSREGYHLVSILFHALAAVVIWRVLIRLGVPWAWLGGMLSAVHPVTVPSVAWLSELKNCLSIFLYSLWILAWLRYDDRPTPRGYVLALALFAMGMLAKASGVALPATIVILAWWRRGRVTWDDLRRTVPFFAFALAIGLIAIWAERAHSLGQSNSRPEGLASRIAAIGWIVWFYYLKDIVPTGLAMVYPRWAISPTDILSWAPLAGLIALGVAAWRFRASWGRPILALLSYTLVALVPVLGLAAMSYHDHSLVSDHFQYLVLPAVMGLVAGTLGWSARRWGGGAKLAGYALAGACVLACLAATWHRAGVFSTSESFWE
ncbi:MAG: glycosyltransferase family 39 protein, partial [Planctomycetota bacterium]|nr:glycosyltransferase family 39 protein [Planctomycetota bacterium]